MKVKCYSVRLESLVSISDKAYKAICKALGMDADEVLRFKRNVKIAEVYKDLNYSSSWEINKS